MHKGAEFWTPSAFAPYPRLDGGQVGVDTKD